MIREASTRVAAVLVTLAMAVFGLTAVHIGEPPVPGGEPATATAVLTAHHDSGAPADLHQHRSDEGATEHLEPAPGRSAALQVRFESRAVAPAPDPRAESAGLRGPAPVPYADPASSAVSPT